ncbi:MAG: hypothetical protein GF355_00890, partial [Candidatus Eisenbacteria bacterium]|nr:hypothetical protein [Candidatus Eisenbacteria bacterium]
MLTRLSSLLTRRGPVAGNLLLSCGAALLGLLILSNPIGAAPFKTTVLDDGDEDDQYGARTSIATTPDGRVQIAHSMNFLRLRITSAPGGSGSTYGMGNSSRKSLQLYGLAEPCLAVETRVGDEDPHVRVYRHLSGQPSFTSPREAVSPALRLDEDEKAHVAFYQKNVQGSGWDVCWATDLFGSWNVDWIKAGVDLDTNSNENQLALALSPSGIPRVAYQDAIRVIYATYDTPWETEVVDSYVHPRNLALDIDPSGVPHISYSTYEQLRYATKNGSSWELSVVASLDPDDNIYSSLAVDSQGTPHISYYDTETKKLAYAYRTGGEWVHQVLDTLDVPYGYIGKFNSIDIDAYDNIHISYKGHSLYQYESHQLRYAWMMDCNDNGIHDSDEIEGGQLLDCNGNGQPDVCEIELGFVEDCNGNGVPDDCEPDCNGNGTPDDCESFPDCNENGVPDECEEDCNENGIPDDCDIAEGSSEDCNRNDIPDECEDFADCNENGIPDECDVLYGGYADCDKNGVPDECDLEPGGEGIDCNENGEMDLCELEAPLSFETSEWGWFGHAVVSADFNGDGLSDIAVGQPHWNGDRGRILVYYGSDPMDTDADELLENPTYSDLRGFSLAAGDFNGDPYDDLAFGSPAQGGDNGVVAVFLGTAESGLAYEGWFGGGHEDEMFGWSLAMADIDGDGLDDVIVGAGAAVGSPSRTHVYAFSPNALGGGDPMEIWQGAGEDDGFGASVANAGDVDGNGLEDVIVGADGGSSTQDVGRAYLFLSQPGGGSTDGPVLSTGTPEDQFGFAVGGAGDVNHDGFADVLVGAPRARADGIIPGRAYLYFGNASPDGDPDLVFQGEEDLADLGSAVAGVGDLNADGFDDLAIGSDHYYSGVFGWVDVFLGGPHLD